jgi:O-antigen/teichoic acid export membrane protein
MGVPAARLAREHGIADAEGERITADAPGAHRIVRNIGSLTAAYVVPRLCTFAAAVVAARVLGVTAFGAWGSAAALAVILSVTATLGMLQMLVREIARSPERAPALIGAANMTKVVTSTLMIGATVLVAAGPLGYESDVVAAALLLSLAYGVGAFAENLGAWYQGIERMEVWMQAQALYGLVTGVLGIALAVSTHDLVWFCLAPVVGQAVALAWLLRGAPTAIRTAWTAPLAEVRRLLAGLAPFAAAFLLLTAYYKVDILLLERWRGTGEAGVYAAAYRFVDVAQALSVVVASALYPRFSRLADRPGRAAVRSIELVLLAAVPAAATLWLLRVPVVAMLFGDTYSSAAGALSLLAPALPLLAVNSLATFVLAAAGRVRLVAVAYAAALVLNVALNAAWAPLLGSAGAARAMLVSEVLLAAGLMLVTSRRGAETLRARPLVAAAAVAAIAFATGSSIAAPFTAVLAFLAVAAVVYVLLRVVPADERRALLQAMRG